MYGFELRTSLQACLVSNLFLDGLDRGSIQFRRIVSCRIQFT